MDVSELVDKFVLSLIHHSNDILCPRFNLREDIPSSSLSNLDLYSIFQSLDGRDQAPGVDRGVAVGDHPQVLQAAARYDRLQGSSILLSGVISEMI